MDTVEIIRQLQMDSALKAQLRAVLLGDELLALPELVKNLIEGIGRVEEQIAENSRQIAELVLATQDHSKWLLRLENQVGEIDGTQLEQDIRSHPRRYLQRKYVVDLHWVPEIELEKLLDTLSEDEQSELDRVDAVLSGTRRLDNQLVYVAVEASATAKSHDLERALKQARLLAKASCTPSLPLVVTRNKSGGRIVDKAKHMGIALSTKHDGLVLEAPWTDESH